MMICSWVSHGYVCICVLSTTIWYHEVILADGIERIQIFSIGFAVASFLSVRFGVGFKTEQLEPSAEIPAMKVVLLALVYIALSLTSTQSVHLRDTDLLLSECLLYQDEHHVSLSPHM